MGLGNSLQTAQGGAAAGGPSGGWVELARTTLGSANSNIDVTGLADKRYLMILSDLQSPSGGELPYFRAGNGSYDSGSNYAMRYSADGGSDATTSSNSNAHFRGAGMGTNDHFDVTYIANLSAKEKLGQWWNVCRSTAGAGTAPTRDEGVFKHAFTSNPYNQIQRLTLSAETYATGSEVVVLGWDPADSHTTNFWEDLGSVTWSSGAALPDLSFTAKKYLWVQFWTKYTSGANRATIQLGSGGAIDTGANYAARKAENGGADGTSTSYANALICHTGSQVNYTNMFIVNNSANEKLIIWHTSDGQSGAGSAPGRIEGVGKWVNTSAQANIIRCFDTTTAFGGGEMKIWGSD